MPNNLLLTIVCIQLSHSQHADPEKEVQKLLALGKDYIVTLALEEITQEGAPKIKASDFHYIKAFSLIIRKS
ncbi:hypothetical protein [Aquimarina sp. RZ0]|uniref:hypothetical protein n=1 Tax=Aquimarina sp. RZ0 TaxID=2607730 RepID=UPI0011F2CF3E|nr:hypothetical protein [Aquimarina sp. RZ0]KAA1243848.1 hypothetical protein F0000_19350 [Aquimarina sp. RZ0]